MTVINTNVKALFAQNALSANEKKLSVAMERLSSGSRINSAADDAAGLGIATRMTSQVRGLNMAIRNASDTISVTQTAEGAMTEVADILQRMRELSVQAASDQNSSSDRAFLQAEVSQLSQEIDRIATTTQFNNMNLLDGSYANKTFQIGANAGQTIGLSIGSMKADVLGVATAQVATTTPQVSSTASISGVNAEGVAAEATVVKLTFEDSGSYAFTIADDVSGLPAAGLSSAAAVDLGSAVSKQDFVDTINKALKEAAGNNTITGSTSLTGANTVDLTDADNYDIVRFSIGIGEETEVAIDLRDRLSTTSAVTMTAVTYTQIATAITSELAAIFDDSVSAAITSGNMVVTDLQGRAITLSQGMGDGTLFGTDADNSGALTADKKVQTNLSVAWSGNDLLITNSAGGQTTVAAVDTPAGSKLIFDVVSGAPGQDYDPVVLTDAVLSDDAVTYRGSVEPSSIAVSFLDRFGNGTTATASFDITDGSGNVYGSVSGLNIFETAAEADVVTAVVSALSSGIATLDNSDESIDLGDFDVAFENGTLLITNRDGSALAIENYASAYTAATVTPLNEIGQSKTLSSQGNMYSEARIRVNSAAFGNDYSTDDIKFTLSIAGQDGTADSIDLSTAFDGSVTGAQLAAALEAEITTDASTFLVVTGGTATQSVSNFKVVWDEDTSELVIRDSLGRNFELNATDYTYSGTNLVFLDEHVVAAANNTLTAQVNSNVAVGSVSHATSVTMSLSGFSDNTTEIDFELNGMTLSAATSVDPTSASAIDWDSTQDFSSTAARTRLDALMAKLNSVHGSQIYSYSVSGNDITFVNSAGGELTIGNFKTDGTGNSNTVAELRPGVGVTGAATTIGYHEVLATANASGTRAVATSATLSLQSDDLVSFTISDGTDSYTLSPTAVDISSSTSVNAFVTAVTAALNGSSISVTMDTDGNINFRDRTGGAIAVTQLTTGSRNSVTWTPAAGQGNAQTLSSGFVGSASASSGTSANVVSSGGTAISQISVSTAAEASAALQVIDSALTYVNAERSKLGAVENRLNHTINNLANIVTNTEASKSRILDTDYATETTNLAKSQIIQQAATAMLAQANQSSQAVLSLLQ